MPASPLLLGVRHIAHDASVIKLHQQQLFSILEDGDKQIETAVHDFRKINPAASRFKVCRRNGGTEEEQNIFFSRFTYHDIAADDLF